MNSTEDQNRIKEVLKRYPWVIIIVLVVVVYVTYAFYWRCPPPYDPCGPNLYKKNGVCNRCPT